MQKEVKGGKPGPSTQVDVSAGVQREVWASAMMLRGYPRADLGELDKPHFYLIDRGENVKRLQLWAEAIRVR